MTDESTPTPLEEKKEELRVLLWECALLLEQCEPFIAPLSNVDLLKRAYKASEYDLQGSQ